ncbi:MAG: GNAT family N-acetyltransferase [Actinobacteria bacterium]|nr:GNAT family N-acetyltransferase [Actinomycetota bacterium]
MAIKQPTLSGERVLLRPVRPEDLPGLREILAEPEIARWWNPGEPDQLLADWLDMPPETVFVIETEGEVIGSIEFSEEKSPDYRHAGIDLFLDSVHHGQGLGSDTLRTMARYLFEERGHHRLTIDPDASNERAIHVYRRVGFRPVGIMRSCERGADGSWHDCLLLEMLKGELS